jgi:hypothetical protein
MTYEEHRLRHMELQEALHELVADWMAQTDDDMTAPVWSLATWAKRQTISPTENLYHAERAHLPVIQVDRG